eukprot:6211228-Pleurochrysis_carterae.AAC.2
MCVRACVCACGRVYVRACACACARACACASACACACAACACACACACVRGCLRVLVPRVRACAGACVCGRVRVPARARVCVRVCVRACVPRKWVGGSTPGTCRSCIDSRACALPPLGWSASVAGAFRDRDRASSCLLPTYACPSDHWSALVSGAKSASRLLRGRFEVLRFKRLQNAVQQVQT